MIDSGVFCKPIARMSGQLPRLIAGMLIILLVFSGALAADEGNVVVAKPSYRSVVLTGFTRARASMTLVAENAGRVLEVVADVGDVIDEHGLFARIDPTFIDLDLKANQIQQKQLAGRNSYDRQELARHRSLLDKGSASQSLYDQLQQTLNDNRHRLEELKVQELVLQEKLARTEVRAAPGWRVIQRLVEPGQYVALGTVLGEVADYSTLLLPLALDPAQFAALRKLGASFEVELPDWQPKVSARVYRVNPGFDEQTRKIKLDLVLESGLPERRGGLRARLRLGVPEQTNAVLLPTEALEESYDEYWLTRENGQRLRVVRLGNGPDAGSVRVSAQGIQPGDRFRLPGQE
jgi:RND family efflux transporter MFP subunit